MALEPLVDPRPLQTNPPRAADADVMQLAALARVSTRRDRMRLAANHIEVVGALGAGTKKAT